jgi:uncharacterized protein (TIGR03437 family)
MGTRNTGRYSWAMRVSIGAFISLAVTAGLQAQTGTPVPQLAAFDQAMNQLMTQYNVPGGALALTRNGHLVFARGYGYADTSAKTPVQPDSVFRIASLSKPLTTVAILTLVTEGKLNLDDDAFQILSNINPPPGSTPDPRLKNITVRELLQHSGGWNDSVSPDPVFMPDAVAATLGTQAPASSDDMVRYMMGQPLNFTPGTQYVYSNFGYLVLGRIIEQITGMKYEQYVRTHVLLPAGVTAMRIGNTLPVGKLPNEVNYYDTFDKLTQSVFPFISAQVPVPYGGWYLEALDSAAGWVASPIDYLKFMNAIEGRRGEPLLTPGNISDMSAEPSTWTNGNHWYGMGFNFTTTPQAGYLDWWADGDFEGTYTQVVRTYDGSDWVVMFNEWPNDADAFGEAVNQVLWNVYDGITSWPTTDQFSSWPDATTPAPSVNAQDGVVSAANLQRGIVPGSWISILGNNLSANAAAWTSAEFNGNNLPLSLNHVSVTVDGKPAAVSYVGPGQIDAQVPEDTNTGAVVVTVTSNGVTTSPVVAEIRDSAPGLFSYGAGLAAAAHKDGSVVGNTSLNPATRPATPGETIMLYGTGFLPSPAGITIDSTQAIADPVVTIGGKNATVSYAGLVAPGLFQVNVVVPNIAAGSYAVQGTMNGTLFLGAVSVDVGN